MLDFDILEPAIDPNNRISFLLDWELTMKCNLDCSYCPTGPNGSHDNSTSHPPLEKCLKSIDFMFEYVDLYMQRKPKGIKYVFLNVYGGEGLHHPDIVKILNNVKERYKKYQDRWHLTITSTTNAIISKKKLLAIIPLIDEFTVSYHAENTSKQVDQFKENLLLIHQSQSRLKCVVMMHSDPELFQNSQHIIKWLSDNGIKCQPKQIDQSTPSLKNNMPRFDYNTNQIFWFENFYSTKSYNIDIKINSPPQTNQSIDSDNNVNLSDIGRACCGGRQLCEDSNYKNRRYFVKNKFPNWYCSVNEFFLFVKQINGEVYVNKDCKMNFNGTVGPIGYLDNTDSILSTLKTQLDSNTQPIIQCKKNACICGLCAPKAKQLDTYNQIMKKYHL